MQHRRRYWRFVRIALLGLKFTPAYIDDILVASKWKKEHQEYLRIHFKGLKELLSYYQRCQMCICDCIRSISRIPTSIETTPPIENVKAVVYLKPSIANELRQFLGILNFSRPFIQLSIQSPQNDLLKRDIKRKLVLLWAQKQDMSMMSAKIALQKM